MSTTTIEVRVNKAHSDALTSDTVANTSVMATLKQAGIPVVGTTSIRSVTRGALTISTHGHEYLYSWTGAPSKAPRVAVKPTSDDELI